MHRTEGEDFDPDVYGDGSNKSGHQTANPPTQFATRFTSSLANALQEEICNVIEGVGNTVYGDSATDDGNWDQLYTAIFESFGIGTNAIENDSITPAKFSDTSRNKFQKKTAPDKTTTGVISELTFVLQSNKLYRYSFSADYFTGINAGGSTVFVDIQLANGTIPGKRIKAGIGTNAENDTFEISQSFIFETGAIVDSYTLEVNISAKTAQGTLRNAILQVEELPHHYAGTL